MSYWEKLSKFQKTKLIVIGTYLIFNLIMLIVSFKLSLNDLKFLVDVSQFIPYMRYVSLLGMALFLALVGMDYWELKLTREGFSKAENEIHLLKSRLFDLEEAEKKRNSEKNIIK